MKVLVQFWDIDTHPVGIWWIGDDDLPENYFPEPDPAEALTWMTLSAKVPDVSWDAYFDALAERTPTFADYEVFDISEPPMDFLDRLQRIASR